MNDIDKNELLNDQEDLEDYFLDLTCGLKVQITASNVATSIELDVPFHEAKDKKEHNEKYKAQSPD